MQDSDENTPQTDSEEIKNGCLSIFIFFLTVLGIPCVIGLVLSFFANSNLFYGGFCGIISILVGFSILKFYVITRFLWHVIKCIFTLRFSKIFSRIDELENSNQEKMGLNLGWMFIASSLLVYLASAYLIMADNNDKLMSYAIAGMVQGSVFWFAFAKGYLDFEDFS